MSASWLTLVPGLSNTKAVGAAANPGCCPPTLELGKEVVGEVSYYGKGFYGKRTASGEIMTDKVLSCAHRTLPFGTMLEITNRRNGKRVVCRVNDRGPYVSSRVVDISYTAAEQLGMVANGVQPLVVMIVGCCGETYISTPHPFIEGQPVLETEESKHE